MSEGNVEVVRRGYEAFNRGDFDGMIAEFAPTFRYMATGAIPGFAGVYRGPEDWSREFVGWFGEFEDPHVEITELIDAGDKVLVQITAWGRGKQSGVESGWHLWQLWTLRDCKIIRGVGFTNRDEALEAAGLSD